MMQSRLYAKVARDQLGSRLPLREEGSSGRTTEGALQNAAQPVVLPDKVAFQPS